MARARKVRWFSRGVLVATAASLAGCPSDPRPRGTMDAGVATNDLGVPLDIDEAGPTLGDSFGSEQLPPTTGREAMRAWLAAGSWRRWACETDVHPPRGLSPHILDRVCTNDALASTDSAAPWPVGAASVKEIHDPRMPAMVVGYAVARKVREGSDGSNWFWFEYFIPGFMTDPPIPTEPDGTVAEGFGDHGRAHAVCVSCHARSAVGDAGGAGDFVFSRVGRDPY